MTGFLGIAFRLLSIVPSIIILVGCCIIFGKMKNEGAVLMLIGMVLRLSTRLIATTLSLLPTPWMIDHNVLGKMAFALPFISIPASFLFAFGFIRFARVVKATL